jgi:uncharacterized delta-60 repeat protein
MRQTKENEMSHKVFYRLASVFLALAISVAGLGSAQAAAGALDPTFDIDGKVTTPIASGAADDHGNAVAVQPDGKIVVAGYSDQGITLVDFALARYNSDGSLDTTFDADGIVTTGWQDRCGRTEWWQQRLRAGTLQQRWLA